MIPSSADRITARLQTIFIIRGVIGPNVATIPEPSQFGVRRPPYRSPGLSAVLRNDLLGVDRFALGQGIYIIIICCEF
jgi:hypothetical protein